ncbi:hypothetical protein QJS66_03240 [Kocuria rhizophila]|nr:hypothetical protein QJS66_03240 [Kocuria rhizophila]
MGSRNLNPAAAVRAVAPAGGYTTSGGIVPSGSTGGAANGQPGSSEADAANGGRYQEFQERPEHHDSTGASATGAHILDNATLVGKKFISAGRQRLRLPSTDEMRISGGAYQVHRKGSAQTKARRQPLHEAHAVKETEPSARPGSVLDSNAAGAGPPRTSTPPTVSSPALLQRRDHPLNPQRGVWTTR